MLAIKIEFNEESFNASIARLKNAIDDSLDGAARRGADLLKETAVQTHPFQNRTGDLEGSIDTIAPSGRFLEGSLEFGVQATMFYAQYVEDMPDYQYLRLAFNLEHDTLDSYFQDGLDEAAKRAGW